MKLSAKPIPSPGRTEKFPPPLMRFLRTNIGSKSHRAPTRSRSSPMFLRKKANSTTAGETAQEPSSPKVTCMGQVRVRKRSSAKKTRKPGKTEPLGFCRCRWIPRALFCRQTRPKISLPVLRKWGSFFQLSLRRRERGRNDKGNERNDKIEANFEEEEEETEDSEEEEEEGEGDKSRAFSAESNPVPRNALILTRCRSAPYRSSSLASRFWESPLNDGPGEKQSTERVVENGRDERNEERPSSEEVSEGRESEARSGAGDGNEEEEKRAEELGLGLGLGLAILTRCKSEPARIGEKLYPEIGYWGINNYSRGTTRRRRLGFVNSCD